MEWKRVKTCRGLMRSSCRGLLPWASCRGLPAVDFCCGLGHQFIKSETVRPAVGPLLAARQIISSKVKPSCRGLLPWARPIKRETVVPWAPLAVGPSNVKQSCRGLPCRGLPCRGLPCRGLPCRGLPCRGLPCRGLAFVLILHRAAKAEASAGESVYLGVGSIVLFPAWALHRTSKRGEGRRDPRCGRWRVSSSPDANGRLVIRLLGWL